MSVSLPKWIGNLFIFVIVVTFFFIFYLTAFNKNVDVSSLEASSLKERIEFSLQEYGNLDDCIFPERYGFKLIRGDDEKVFNYESYFKEDCIYKTHYCKEFDFKINGEKVKLDVVFKRS